MTTPSLPKSNMLRLEAVAQELMRSIPKHLSVDGRVAIGFRTTRVGGIESWAIVDFATPDRPTVSEYYGGTADPIDHGALNSNIIISAKWQVWESTEASSLSGVLELIDQGLIHLSGRLSYFIRHARSTAELIAAVGQAAKVLSISD